MSKKIRIIKNTNMSYLVNNQQKINEIVFANRNKSYGAYTMRSEYGNTVLKSLSIMLLSFGTIMSLAFYLVHRNSDPEVNSITTVESKQDTTITVEVNLDKKIEPPAVVQPPQNNSASAAISTVISESVTAETNTVTNESNTGVGTSTNTEGPPGPSTPSTDPGTGTTTAVPTTSATDTYYVADSNPEYEGGLRALYAFLGSKVKYPEPAFEAGKEGTVYVKFVVDQNGKVCNLSLLNHLGFGLDEEALRVVGLIPNFKTPGMMGGKPVRVYYQLPLKFKMH